jgi:hypothetical protein
MNLLTNVTVGLHEVCGRLGGGALGGDAVDRTVSPFTTTASPATQTS